MSWTGRRRTADGTTAAPTVSAGPLRSPVATRVWRSPSGSAGWWRSRAWSRTSSARPSSSPSPARCGPAAGRRAPRRAAADQPGRARRLPADGHGLGAGLVGPAACCPCWLAAAGTRAGRDAAALRAALSADPGQGLRDVLGAGYSPVLLLNVVRQPPAGALGVATTVVLGGLSTIAVGYLIVERFWRPISAAALHGGAPEQPALPGVASRLGAVLAAGHRRAGARRPAGGPRSDRLPKQRFALTVAILAGIALDRRAARPGVRRPVRRRPARRGSASAVGKVAEGDLDVSVRVYDGSEIGLLQSGVNRMAEGLRERGNGSATCSAGRSGPTSPHGRSPTSPSSAARRARSPSCSST